MPTEEELEQKRLEAKRALEGPEWTAKREQETKEKKQLEEKTRMEIALAEITKQKEGLELDWIKLDDQRNVVREALTPILEREKQAEETETKLELEEARPGLAKDKQEIEKKRWAVQDARREAEKGKWSLQEKLWQIEEVIEKNTVKYRALLAQEEEAQKRLSRSLSLGSEVREPNDEPRPLVKPTPEPPQETTTPLNNG